MTSIQQFTKASPAIRYIPRFRQINKTICSSIPKTQEINRRQTLSATLVLLNFSIVKKSNAGLIFGEKENGKLPKDYLNTVKKLVTNLKESIQIELDGAEEREVRRKADSAKDLVKEFVSKWRDDPRVKFDPTYTNISEALQELGQFYMKNGQRTRLTDSVANSVLQQLQQAQITLDTY